MPLNGLPCLSNPEKICPESCPMSNPVDRDEGLAEVGRKVAAWKKQQHGEVAQINTQAFQMQSSLSAELCTEEVVDPVDEPYAGEFQDP